MVKLGQVQWAMGFLALMAFFIPVGTAGVNVFALLTIVAVLLGRESRLRLAHILKDPLSWMVLGFYGLCLLSLLNPLNDPGFDSVYLAKYARLLIIPFLAAAVANHRQAVWVLKSFLMGVLLSVMASYAVYFGWVEGSYNTYFKAYLTYSFFLALGLLWLLLQVPLSVLKKPNAQTFVFLLLFVLGAFNLFFVVNGRTGWLALFTAIACLALFKLDFKKALLFVLFMALALVGLYFLSADFHGRINKGVQEVANWFAHPHAVGENDSMGLRLSYWYYSSMAFLQHPWLGVGLGGFQKAVGEFSAPNGFAPFRNPHNQFFLFAVQLGVVGLFVYLGLLLTLITRAVKHNSVWLYVFLVAFTVSNLVNSFHYDFAESYSFALMVALFAFRSKGPRQLA